MCKQKWGGAIIPSLRLHTHISAQQVVSKSSLSWELLQPWYMWKFEVEVATWHMVEASVHIAWTQHGLQASVGWCNTILTATHTHTCPTVAPQWTQHGCASKSGLVQYHPYGSKRPYMSHIRRKWPLKLESAATMIYVEGWGGSGNLTSSWASVYIAWTQDGCASKSDGVVQYHPYGYTHLYVPHK